MGVETRAHLVCSAKTGKSRKIAGIPRLYTTSCPVLSNDTVYRIPFLRMVDEQNLTPSKNRLKWEHQYHSRLAKLGYASFLLA